MGVEGARQILGAGANDVGGTLIDENISRAAGASHGQRMGVEDLDELVGPARPAARAAHHPLRPAPHRPRHVTDAVGPTAPGASGDPAPRLATVPVPSAIAPSGPADEAAIDAALASLVGGRELSRTQRTLMRSMLTTLWALSRDGTAMGDLKIADAALAEMTEAFRVFRPYRHVRKVTMFGSARTQPADPVYVLARDLADPHGRGGLDGGHRRRPRHHGRRHRGGGARPRRSA